MVTEIPDALLLIITFTIVAVLYKIIPFLFKKTGMPEFIGWIILGIILATPLIEGTSITEFLKIDHISGHEGSLHGIIRKISETGVIFLIFSASLKISIKDMISVGKTAFPVAFFGAVIPFIFGLAYIMQFHDNLNCALFLAASMVATSVCVTVYIIKNLHLLHTKEAKIIISAAIIDDILGMVALAAVCYEAGPEENTCSINDILLCAFGLIITIALSIYFIIPWIQKNIRKSSTKLIPFIFSISLCLILANATNTLRLSSIIGAFMAGSILFKHAETWELNKKIELIASCLLPFFFIDVGIHVDICSINSDILSTIAIVVVLAVTGKYLGCFIGAKIIDKSMSAESASIVGIGMIPRGEVGIIVASFGLKANTIPNELYTAVIFMCVITTMIAPPLLSTLLKKKYGDNTKIVKPPNLY